MNDITGARKDKKSLLLEMLIKSKVKNCCCYFLFFHFALKQMRLPPKKVTSHNLTSEKQAMVLRSKFRVSWKFSRPLLGNKIIKKMSEEAELFFVAFL